MCVNCNTYVQPKRYFSSGSQTIVPTQTRRHVSRLTTLDAPVQAAGIRCDPNVPSRIGDDTKTRILQ